MIVGLDFDNTIVCYDGLFHRAAVERRWIKADTPASKQAVRDAMRAAGREADWTELQGHVYGREIQRAAPFAGIAEFLERCRSEQVTVHVISHRTRHPFAGPAIDLHAAARDWLESQGWYRGNRHGLDRERVHFEQTKSEKLARIAATGCTLFVDDLPEFLAEESFPRGVARILFDPHAVHPRDERFRPVHSWKELSVMLFERGDR